MTAVQPCLSLDDMEYGKVAAEANSTVHSFLAALLELGASTPFSAFHLTQISFVIQHWTAGITF